MKKFTRSLSVAFLLSLLTVSGHAVDLTAYIEGGPAGPSGSGAFPGDTAGTGPVGFNFTLSTSISVTQLGFLGDNLGGGDTPWVAIYDLTTNTQVAAITTFGNGYAGWKYIALPTPVTLTAGDTYQVAATAYWAPKYTDTSGFTFGAGINPIGYTAPTGFTSWGTPFQISGAALTSGPQVEGNFQYTAVPEPTSYAMLGMAALALNFLRRKRALAGSLS